MFNFLAEPMEAQNALLGYYSWSRSAEAVNIWSSRHFNATSHLAWTMQQQQQQQQQQEHSQFVTSVSNLNLLPKNYAIMNHMLKDARQVSEFQRGSDQNRTRKSQSFCHKAFMQMPHESISPSCKAFNSYAAQLPAKSKREARASF